jgi:DNA-binding NarL/FixJ family response regulator
MIRVILADDHAVVRKGLQLIIDLEPGLQLVGEAANGEGLLRLIHKQPADVLLLDLDMPRGNGLSALKQIKEAAPGVKVIVLSMHPQQLYGKTARQLGASGYVSKVSEPRVLIESMQRVHHGEEVFDDSIKVKSVSKKPIKLSEREIQVLKLLSNGKSNKDISEELIISDKTVSTYKFRLLNKIGGKTVVDLINFSKNYPEIMQPG